MGKWYQNIKINSCGRVMITAGAFVAVTLLGLLAATAEPTTPVMSGIIKPALAAGDEGGYGLRTSGRDAPYSDDNYMVQAVLSPRNHAVIASGIDAQITKMNFESGDKFKKGDVLVEFDCTMDYGRLNEMRSRQRVTERQLDAYKKLQRSDSVSDIEMTVAKENNEQNKAQVQQIEGRLKACRMVAPYAGRVVKRMASKFEYVQTGRVLMEIASSEPLRAEFLIPSKWLRWLNVGTPLKIEINETGRRYNAHIVAVYGEVDPVSQSVQVMAEMEDYHEELLSGMSGRAVFDPQAVNGNIKDGFLGLDLLTPAAGDKDGASPSR